MFAPLRVRVPAPVFRSAPAPSMTPLKVRVVPAVSTWKAPVPPVAMVNFLVLEAVAPVYSNVPVTPPVSPRITESALLPNSPFALALLMVSIFKVPAWTVSWPV